MCCAEVSESFTGCPWPGWARSFPGRARLLAGKDTEAHHITSLLSTRQDYTSSPEIYPACGLPLFLFFND